MALTGKSFKTNFERRIDKSFNDYYDDETLSDFFIRGLRMAIMSRYDYLDGQKRLDELRTLIIDGKIVPAASGKIMLQSLPVIAYDDATGVITLAYPHNASAGELLTIDISGSTGSFSGSLLITAVSSLTITCTAQTIGTFVKGSVTTIQSLVNYLHLNSMKVNYKIKYEEPIMAFEVTPSSASILFDKRVSLRDGEKVVIENVVGATSLNGTWYVSRTGLKKYQLFEDAELKIPVVGNSKYISGGDLYLSFTSDKAFQDKPDEVDYTAKPTFKMPGWRIDSGALCVAPEVGVVSLSVNYIRQPFFDIDPENDDLDMELYLPREFWEYVIDYMAQLFDLETKDGRSFNLDNYQLVKNQ
jgi:hypothetical protein